LERKECFYWARCVLINGLLLQIHLTRNLLKHNNVQELDKLIEMGIAIRKTIVIIKRIVWKRFVALMTVEVLWMPRCTKCSDSTTTNRLVTSTTFLRENIMNAHAAVRSILPLEIAGIIKGSETVRAHKTF